MSRCFVIAVLSVLSLTSVAADRAHAQQVNPTFQLDLSSALSNAVTSPAVIGAEQIGPLQGPSFAPLPRPRGSALLATLYASTAAMQALDVHSSLRAFSNGAVESNPLMAGVTKNKAAFMAVKAGVAVSTIFAAKNMAKKNKVAAIATLVAINSAYALVVSHNYRAAR
jgi:hypothetical protein